MMKMSQYRSRRVFSPQSSSLFTFPLRTIKHFSKNSLRGETACDRMSTHTLSARRWGGKEWNFLEMSVILATSLKFRLKGEFNYNAMSNGVLLPPPFACLVNFTHAESTQRPALSIDSPSLSPSLVVAHSTYGKITRRACCLDILLQ